MQTRKKKIYAYYKGDKYICEGTLEELGEKFKVKPRTIMFYASPTYQKRNKCGNNIFVVKVDDDE